MTDFLTINSVPYLVDVSGGAVENEPDYGGSRERAFAGNLRSTRDTPKSSWSFPLAEMSPATLATLKAAVANDAIVPVGGAAIVGGPINCMVDVAEAPYVRDGTAAHKRRARVNIQQV
jgi:hypothetical protein